MTPEVYIDRVRSLLPALRERAPRAEQLRRLPDETFADFQEAGLFRALQPKRYGGYELDPGTLYQAVMEVGTMRVERLDTRGYRGSQLAPGDLSGAGARGCLGRRHQPSALDITGADGDGRAGRWRLSSPGPLVVLQWMRLLPLGSARRDRALRR